MVTTTELLTFAQAAERLGVGVLDVRRMVRTEQCPVVRDGRRVANPGRLVRRPGGLAGLNPPIDGFVLPQ
jgi:excisionase family DNA binding protein